MLLRTHTCIAMACGQCDIEGYLSQSLVKDNRWQVHGLKTKEKKEKEKKVETTRKRIKSSHDTFLNTHIHTQKKSELRAICIMHDCQNNKNLMHCWTENKEKVNHRFTFELRVQRSYYIMGN